MRWALLIAALTACGGTGNVYAPRDTGPDPVFVGVLELDPVRIDIVDAALDVPTTGLVRVQNVGDYPLELVSAEMTESAGGVLTTDVETNAGRVISPDRAYEVLVVCRYRQEPLEPVEGVLRLITDDPERPQVDVPVTCTPAGWTGDTDTDGG